MKTKVKKCLPGKIPVLMVSAFLVLSSLIMCVSSEEAGSFYVDANAKAGGDGSKGSPFRTIQEGVDVAQPGETIWVLPGEYSEGMVTKCDGLPGKPVTIRSFVSAAAPEGAAPGWVPEDESQRVWIRLKGRGIDILHSHIVVDGINVDGLWYSNAYIDSAGIFRDSTVTGLFPSGTNGIVRIDSGKESIVLRNMEITNNQLHLVRIHGNDILIDNARIHNGISRTVNSPAPKPGMVSMNDNFRDAHGIEASNANRFRITNSHIYDVSGDCVQSGRSVWSEFVVENCDFEMRPLPEPILGLEAGTWMGEDLYDTKTPNRGRDNAVFNKGVTYRNNLLHGTQYSRILHGAVLNLKEGVEEILVEGNRIYDNRMTFRLRQPTKGYIIRNNFIFNNETAVWFAGPVDNVQILNNTFFNNKVAVTESQSGATNSVISKNIFANGTHEMDLKLPEIRWENNLFHKVSAPQGENFIESDPLFTNPEKGDFSLLPNSPALQAGIGASLPKAGK